MHISQRVSFWNLSKSKSNAFLPILRTKSVRTDKLKNIKQTKQNTIQCTI